MPAVEPRVELLAHTPEPLSLIYAAFRQCYHAGFVADMWPRLLDGEISRERQAEFVASVLASGHASHPMALDEARMRPRTRSKR